MNSMPVGFRFRPTDEELVGHYLNHKLLGNDSLVHNVIAEVDVCKFEPWNLPALSVVKSDDPEWFFFSPPDYKYAKSKRFNRATKCGFWKATGKDRNIKTRGTNDVIGTKKTLVFYEGHAPGVKTNWVIHEYHSGTIHESRRTFVLCRLMKKAEKKSEGGTDTLTSVEGEPSRYMGSDYENQATVEAIPDGGVTMSEMDMEASFQAPYQEDQYFPCSAQQFPVANEQEESSLNSPFLGAYFRNENNIMQTPLETIDEKDEFTDSFAYFRDENNSMQTSFEITKEQDEFVNSFLADADVVFSGNIGYASVNGPTHSKSLRRGYYESSDTDAEAVSAPCGNTLDASTISQEHLSSGEFHASKMSKSSHGAVHGSTSFLSSNNDANKDKNESLFQDNFFLGMETSSCDSTAADKPLEINCFEISSCPSTPRKRKKQCHPRPATFVSQRAAARGSQTQGKVSSDAVSHTDC